MNEHHDRPTNDQTVADSNGDVSRRRILKGLAIMAAAAPTLRPERLPADPKPPAVDEGHDMSNMSEEHVRATRKAPVRLAAAGDPAEVGEWSAPFTPHNITAVHAVLLHTGKVLILRDTDAYLWDPATSGATEIDLVEDNFCAAQAVTSNGDVLFAGGVFDEFGHGPKWTYTFRPKTGEWTKGPDMRGGRWYPSATSLHDGRIMILGGKLEDGGFNEDIEVWKAGVLSLVGTRKMDTYPHLFGMPDGRVLVAGTGVLTASTCVRSKASAPMSYPKCGCAAWVPAVVRERCCPDPQAAAPGRWSSAGPQRMPGRPSRSSTRRQPFRRGSASRRCRRIGRT